MIERNKLVKYLGEVFAEVDFPDYSYNGLQFEGKEQVSKIAAGVDANIDFFTAANEAGADFALVHHGLFWKGAEWTRLDRINKKIAKTLLDYDLNLYASHLPLDAHPKYGNNAVLARMLGAEIVEPFGGSRNPVGFLTKLPEPMPVDKLKALIEAKIGTIITHLAYGKDKVSTIGIVSGGGWSSFSDERVYDGEVDLILTGEVIHQAVASCKDREIHMISAGHYATEVFGVKELGQHLAEKFNLEYCFIDLPTGL